MYYLVISFISLGALLFLEGKRIKFSKKFGNELNFYESFKNNFNVVNFVFIPLIFGSLFMVLYTFLEQNDIVVIVRSQFKFSHLPYIMYSICTVPIIEEYFYRFFPYSFKRFKHIFIYIVILIFSSLIFAYSHQVGIYESIIILVLAIILSVIYLKTRNISYTIMCHSFYNFLILVNQYININNIFVYLVISGIFFVILFINKREEVKI